MKNKERKEIELFVNAFNWVAMEVETLKYLNTLNLTNEHDLKALARDEYILTLIVKECANNVEIWKSYLELEEVDMGYFKALQFNTVNFD